MASGNLVYAGGTFTNLGATPRTYLGALDLTPGPSFGAALPFAPKLENLGGPNHPPTVPPVVQALDISPDGSRLFVGGNFDHINGVPRTNFAVLDLPSGDVDPGFDAGEPQGTVRAVKYEPSLGLVYIGGDFDSIVIPASARLHRPDNDNTCGTPAHRDSTLLSNNRCVWQRSKLAALNATTGVVDMGFQGPTSTGPGLIGNGGKTCPQGSSACGTGAVLAIHISPDKHQLYASGSFSELDKSGHRNTIMALYNDGPNRGRLTPWQPQARPASRSSTARSTRTPAGCSAPAAAPAGGPCGGTRRSAAAASPTTTRPGSTSSTATPRRSTCPNRSATGAATSTSSTAGPTSASTPPPSTSTTTSPRTGTRSSTPARACSRSRSCPTGS